MERHAGLDWTGDRMIMNSNPVLKWRQLMIASVLNQQRGTMNDIGDIDRCD